MLNRLQLVAIWAIFVSTTSYTAYAATPAEVIERPVLLSTSNSISALACSALVADQADLAYNDIVMTDRPVAYYRLDEREGMLAHDHTTNHVDLLIFGGVAPLTQGALVHDLDSAMTFDGSGYLHIDAEGAKSLRMSSSFSVEAWINPKNYDDTQCILSKGNDQSFGYYRLLYNSTKQKYQFNVKFDQSGTFGEDVFIDRKLVSLFDWHHMVGVYDAVAHELRYYLDGKMISSLDVTGKTLTPNNEDFEIASMPDPKGLGFDYFLNGAIDEVAIYKTVLSPARIARHYNFGMGRK